jgi:predicted transcriptional regulator
MARRVRLTERELDVMSILWRMGSGTVTEVRKELGEQLAYTTVLWVLQTLDSKGFVRRTKEGRAHRYYPAVKRETAGDSAVARIVDKVFHGSAAMLVSQLVSETDLSRDELQGMRDLLDQRLKAPRKHK